MTAMAAIEAVMDALTAMAAIKAVMDATTAMAAIEAVMDATPAMAAIGATILGRTAMVVTRAVKTALQTGTAIAAILAAISDQVTTDGHHKAILAPRARSAENRGANLATGQRIGIVAILAGIGKERLPRPRKKRPPHNGHAARC
eukprot:GHVU01069407.1.p2 GENE.GHVU01069407.1~~GHVU01069407.1.p2  ORF type:complete len:167 (-),score=17.90 GHVU01069407.1:79-513(-)